MELVWEYLKGCVVVAVGGVLLAALVAGLLTLSLLVKDLIHE